MIKFCPVKEFLTTIKGLKRMENAVGGSINFFYVQQKLLKQKPTRIKKVQDIFRYRLLKICKYFRAH